MKLKNNVTLTCFKQLTARYVTFSGLYRHWSSISWKRWLRMHRTISSCRERMHSPKMFRLKLYVRYFSGYHSTDTVKFPAKMARTFPIKTRRNNCRTPNIIVAAESQELKLAVIKKERKNCDFINLYTTIFWILVS